MRLTQDWCKLLLWNLREGGLITWASRPGYPAHPSDLLPRAAHPRRDWLFLVHLAPTTEVAPRKVRVTSASSSGAKARAQHGDPGERLGQQ